MSGPTIGRVLESVGWFLIYTCAAVLIGWWALAFAVGVVLIRTSR